MPVDAQELSQYAGKDIIVVVKGEEGDAHEYEGKAAGASPAGIAFKEKGKRELVLVEPDTIEDISFAPVKVKKVTQKKVNVITEGNMRQHLVDRHGFTIKAANAMDEGEAEKAHDELDHADLGHRHVEKKKKHEDEEASEEQSAA